MHGDLWTFWPWLLFTTFSASRKCSRRCQMTEWLTPAVWMKTSHLESLSLSHPRASPQFSTLILHLLGLLQSLLPPCKYPLLPNHAWEVLVLAHECMMQIFCSDLAVSGKNCQAEVNIPWNLHSWEMFLSTVNVILNCNVCNTDSGLYGNAGSNAILVHGCMRHRYTAWIDHKVSHVPSITLSISAVTESSICNLLSLWLVI